MGSEIVQEFSKDFSLEDLEKAEEMEFEMEDIGENDENILPENFAVFAKKGKRSEGGERVKEDPLFKIEGNLRLQKAQQMNAKKAKKEARRRDRVSDTLSNQMEGAFSALTASKGEAYNVDADFE